MEFFTSRKPDKPGVRKRESLLAQIPVNTITQESAKIMTQLSDSPYQLNMARLFGVCYFLQNGSGPFSSWGQDAQCSAYLVPLVVRNSQGELVHNYSPSDAAVTVDGMAIGVDEIHRGERSRRIVIVLDASGSMNRDRNGHPWRRAVESASVLAFLAKGRAHLALLVFNEKVVEEVGFDRGNSAVEERLTVLQSNRDFERTLAHGKTAINDAIGRAIGLLDDPVSDGEDTSSRAGRSDLERKLSMTGIPVFADILKPPQGPRNGVRLSQVLDTGPDFYEFARLMGGANIQADPEETKLSYAVRRKISAIEAAQLFSRSYV